MAVRLHASIIVTYRCNARCNMCLVWQNPTRPSEEIGLEVIEKLPRMFFANITGGEPFVRKDLIEIVGVVRKKANRIVISTNGCFTDRIVNLCTTYPDVGIRISVEGLEKANDAIRGLPDGFQRAMKTLFQLREMGVKDIGLGMTVQDMNCQDIVPLYQLAESLGYEFATATLHNSHYFHKWDNRIEDKDMVCREFEKLIKLLLGSRRIKNWVRAYFNCGVINYIRGNRRPLPCQMGENGFFLDPWGDVLPCNGMDEKQPMGNLREQTWDEIWNSPRAWQVRQMVAECPKNCWMIGSAAPAIWQHPMRPAAWVLENRLRHLFGRGLDTQLGR